MRMIRSQQPERLVEEEAPKTVSRPSVSAEAKVIPLTAGIYAVKYTKRTVKPVEVFGATFPAMQITALHCTVEKPKVRILSDEVETSAWLTSPGDVVILKVTDDDAKVLLTTYRPAEYEKGGMKVEFVKISQRSEDVTPVQPQVQPQVEPPVPTVRLAAHIQNVGDRRIEPGQWAGAQGSRLRIEAFSIEAAGLSPQSLEYMAIAANGGQTRWSPMGAFCGSKGRGIPIVAFAVRLNGPAAEEFDVVYQGSFFDSGPGEPFKNGELCRSVKDKDPLESFIVRLVRKK
ncbi:hypothetical protein [Desulfovibrio inopinatus]|uniref:hypothetical protein n=1 Tax=Desulfovibrio inopinatus TaxID=102109 RepID=UPI00041EF1F3|nr:hypothetical protein [Desulfovibrio inopinatus]